ncbi:excalibur calcium-binding domain-containing protein [Sphingomonas adhaesiva]|uniref:excalibur calcium-binding domain-containing protein n=1 Tax=Sphingomonas adhaesiva TaxID=28212 RepID=UPI002FF9481E
MSHVLLGGGLVGLAAGAGSLAFETEGRAGIGRAAAVVAIATGMRRAREPVAGDHWGGCHDARSAGTAPIYRGEPGFDDRMDGDGDGVACEPIRD